MNCAVLALPALALVLIPWSAPADTVPTALWSIGSPTDYEQYYLELINRARANPAAEGIRLAATTDLEVRNHYTGLGVNLVLMQSEFAALAPRPPLAMNAKLIEAARGHSADEFDNNFQDHLSSDRRRYIGDRIAAAGYAFSSYGENTYVHATSPWFGHASFQVDWGPGGAGGMQDGRKHRALIHDADNHGFKEIGIGIDPRTKGSAATAWGPVVTQDVAAPAGPAVPFVTGVVYFDFNGNAFYDPGEGIGGVTVNVSGAEYHSVTASSGGYSVPAPAGTAVRNVTFSGLGFKTSETVAITGTDNVKKDLKSVYLAPAVTGPAGPAVGIDNIYALAPVPGASRHDCRVLRKGAAPAAATDNAEDLTRVAVDISPGYSALSTTVKQQGTGSWHLTQPANRAETITFRSTFLGGAMPSVRYQSRLRAASVNQSALVQVSADQGLTWTTVETQTGSGGAGQTSFSLRTVALPSVTNREFLLRFNFTVSGSPANNSTGDAAGWFIDAVQFTGITDTGIVTPLPPGANLFSFVPASAGPWLLSARPVVSGRPMAFGPATEVNAGTVIPPPSFTSWAVVSEFSAGLPAGTLSSAPAADHNGDGVPNLMAYALGLSPVAPSAGQLPQASVSQGSLRLDYSHDTARTDITLTPQVSTGLRTWFTPGQAGAPAGFSDTLLSTNGTVQSRRAAVTASPGQSWYLRLRVTKP